MYEPVMKSVTSISSTLRTWTLVLCLLVTLQVSIDSAHARKKRRSKPVAEEVKPAEEAETPAVKQTTKRGREPLPENKRKGVPVTPTSPAAVKAPALKVPGGGLEAHERVGGHLISKHVGKTEADLLARLKAEPGIFTSSSFHDLETAETVCALAISSRRKEVDLWMGGREDRCTIDFTSKKPIGIIVKRRQPKATPAWSLRLVLDRDPSFRPTGWRIVTGYPQK